MPARAKLRLVGFKLQFRDAGLSVEEDGQGGFGAGVHANEGEYQRISIR
jgi:hypothetical protein